jgi:RNA polymerase primary sigma factor
MKNNRDTILQLYLEEIREYPLLDAQQESELAREIERGNQEARQRLISSNLRLVVNIAKRYSDIGLPLLDLIDEGNLGLMHAAERFDPERGCRFSTYATYWIKHAICRALTEKNQMIRIPSYMRKILSKAKEVARQMTLKGLDPTPEEIVRRLPSPARNEKMVIEAIKTNMSIEGTRSLNPLHDQNESIEDPRSESHVHRVSEHLDMERLEQVLDEIEPRRVRILKMRYGIGPFAQPMTLREIGEQIQLTKERVRQIEKETITQLRTILAPAEAA